MIEKLIHFSVKNKLIVGLFTLAVAAYGVFAMFKLPLDAVPDITNNQVQIVTTSPSLAPQEVEQFITQPLELAMANIPGMEDIRSISRFGLSVITVVFDENVHVLEARQYVKEQLDMAIGDIPESLGDPQMMPITKGLGEIYQYVLTVDSTYSGHYSAMELRTLQDWIVKRQLMGTKGIIEVSSFGGFLKQYEVSVIPERLLALNTTMNEVFEALEANNENSGGSYIQKEDRSFYIRTLGLAKDLNEIGSIVIKKKRRYPCKNK